MSNYDDINKIKDLQSQITSAIEDMSSQKQISVDKTSSSTNMAKITEYTNDLNYKNVDLINKYKSKLNEYWEELESIKEILTRED